MVVGTDTYITLSDANAYITANMTAADPDRVRWESLIDGDREIYLKRACQAIDCLPLHGEAAKVGQPLAFPRLPYQRRDATGAPDTVQTAQVLLAVWMSDTESRASDRKQHALKSQDIKSMSMGSLSMSFGGNQSVTAAQTCPEAWALLKRYCSGGY